MKKNTLLLLLSIFIVACTSIPITSLYKLSKLDLKTIDPKEVKVAIQIPDYLKVGAVKLKISYTPEGAKEKPVVFLLKKVRGLKSYEKYEQKNYSITSYELTEKDVDTLVKFRKNIIQNSNRSGSTKTNNTTKITIQYTSLCRVKSPKDKKPIFLSIYLNTTKTSGFFPLSKNIDLTKNLKQRGVTFNKSTIKLCTDISDT